jgi:HlyD family secretion protein
MNEKRSFWTAFKARFSTVLSRIPLPGWARRHPWRTGILVVVLLLVLLIGFALFRPTPPNYVTATVERGDIEQTVEAVGTVTSERDLELQFPVSGVVDNVLVKEGDNVKAGQRLVTLKAGSLAADVASASANVQSAEASLRAAQEGSRPEDIAIAEAELRNRQASLDAARASLTSAETTLANAKQQLTALQNEANVSLGGYVITSTSTVSAQLSEGQIALSTLDDVLTNTDVQDAIIKNGSGEYDSIRNNVVTARQSIFAGQSNNQAVRTYQDALASLTAARLALQRVADVTNRTFAFIAGLQETSYFTSSDRESLKSQIAAEKASVQSALSSADSAAKTLQDAAASYDSKIIAQQTTIASAESAKAKATTDIETYQTSVQISQAQLDLKRAGSRPADIDAAVARVKQARADLARASARYNESILTAPVDGIITKVNVRLGEYTPVGPSVTLLGKSPYRVEMYSSEVDIPLVALTQSGTIELDAFPDEARPLVVHEIDPAATQIENVSKYKITLDFTETYDDLKIGMKGDVTIITGLRTDVLKVPARSVIENDEGEEIVRVLDEDGKLTEVPVTTGLESDSDIEILSGLSGGETIVVLIKP